uniref:Uncharacterized protein n=1 Tax=Zea mays TaxID=4577 RepID=C4J5D7_MAIZE|nr:unknown [Zea mays]
MHEPRARVVGDEADDGPAKPGHLHRVLEQGVDEVVGPDVLGRVVVAVALREHEEVVAVEVHGVGVALHGGRALEHHLDRGVVREAAHRGGLPRGLDLLERHAGADRDERRVGEVEHAGRPGRQLLHGEAGVAAVLPRLQHGHPLGEAEGDVVHVGHLDGLGLVAASPPAGRPVPWADGALAERDEEAVVDAAPELRQQRVRRQAGQVAVEVERRGRVVLVGHLRHGRRAAVSAPAGRGSGCVVVGVLHYASGYEHRDLRVRRRRLVGERGHVVAAGRGVGDHEHVERLAGRDGHHVGGVRRDVVGVGAHHGELVAGDLEVVLGEERRVHEPEHVRLPLLHVENEVVLYDAGAVVEIAKFSIDSRPSGVITERAAIGEVLVHFHQISLPPFTYDDGNIHMRLMILEWVRAGLGADDDDAMQGCPEDGDVGVPPQRALLPVHLETVGERGVGLDWALRYHSGAIGPTRQALLYAMPVNCYFKGRLVDQVHNHRVPFRGLYRWAWKLTVDHSGQRIIAEVSDIHLLYL